MDNSPIPTTGHPVVDGTIAITVGVGLGISSLAFGLWALWVKVGPLLRRIEGFAKTSAEQTANDHSGAPNPNLRDDLDEKHAQTHSELASVKELLLRIERGQQRQDAELARIQEAQADDREAIRRVDAKIDGHIRDKSTFEPRLIALENRYTKPPA